MILTELETAFVFVSQVLEEVKKEGGDVIDGVRYEIYVDGSGALMFDSKKKVSNQLLRFVEKKLGSVRWSRYEDTWVLFVLKDTLLKLASEWAGLKEPKITQEDK